MGNRQEYGRDPLKGYTKYRNTSIIFCIILIAVFFLFFRKNLKENIYVATGSDSLALESYKGDQAEIPYADIVSVSLFSQDGFDEGSLVNGTETGIAHAGIWENEAYGDYHLFVLPKIPLYLEIRTEQDIFVFNYESEKTTSQLYDAFRKLLDDKGYDDVAYQDLTEETENA